MNECFGERERERERERRERDRERERWTKRLIGLR